MSYHGNTRISHMVRCGWCSAMINTATLNVEIESSTEQMKPLGSTLSMPEPAMDTKPHANCPRCGHILYFKGVKTV